MEKCEVFTSASTYARSFLKGFYAAKCMKRPQPPMASKQKREKIPKMASIYTYKNVQLPKIISAHYEVGRSTPRPSTHAAE